MFVDIIHIKRKEDIRYGSTKIPFGQTFTEIMVLLRKHGCNKIATIEDDGKNKIIFEYQEYPYLITVPSVYVKSIYNDKIRIRIVKYYLETILELTKQRVMDFDFVMLGSRILQIEGQSITLKEAVDKLPPAKLFNGFTTDGLLPEGKRE